MATISVSVWDLLTATQQQNPAELPPLAWLGEQPLRGKVLGLIATRRTVQTALEDFGKARQAIVAKYLGADGKVPPEKEQEVREEIIALAKNECVEVHDAGLTWSDVQSLDWTANRLEALMWLIHDVPKED
jgi:hypothetical protein